MVAGRALHNWQGCVVVGAAVTVIVKRVVVIVIVVVLVLVVVLVAGPVTLPDVRHLPITPSGPH